MILYAIGAVIGLVMGMTGAGGALIAIPLFMHFLDMSLKEASVLSLVAVVIASLSNYFFQRKEASVGLASILVLSSAVGSYFAKFYKYMISDFIIAVLLLIVALYSLYHVWMPSNYDAIKTSKPHFLITILVGGLLGVLTTFTGLGGGVLILPVLISLYNFTEKKAVATSLLVVGLSSLASFLMQFKQLGSFHENTKLVGLAFGILTTSYLLKILVLKVPPKIFGKIRKVTFTIVVLIALLKIFQ